MITRRSLYRLENWGLTIFAIAFSAGILAAEHKPPPNFVFLVADDLGYMDIGANNPETFYETPNIDRLAETGVRFVNAYSASPVCSPTRASIMTGKHPARLGITDYIDTQRRNQPENWSQPTSLKPAAYADRLPLAETTVAEVLKTAGYATFFAGKWHLGPAGFWPEDQGFDVNKGGTDQGGPYGRGGYFPPYDNPRLEDGPPGEHLPDRLASETVEFIAGHRQRPFLAFLSFYSVHTPLMARPDLEAKYARRAQPDGGEAWGVERDRQVRLVQNDPVYAAMVEALDLAIGRVLDSLEAMGLEETTVVILVSDNGGLATSDGYPTANLPLRAGKGWLYEGGIRTPLIVRWPGVTPPGGVSAALAVTTDLFPTVLEMAGISPSSAAEIDGISLASALRGNSMPRRDAIFWHFPHYGNPGGRPGAAARVGDWKLIENFEDGRVELYNLADDPAEQVDLADRRPEVVADLRARLHAWQVQTDADFPQRTGFIEYWWLRLRALF